jgi:hypothetical protein
LRSGGEDAKKPGAVAVVKKPPSGRLADEEEGSDGCCRG